MKNYIMQHTYVRKNIYWFSRKQLIAHKRDNQLRILSLYFLLYMFRMIWDSIAVVIREISLKLGRRNFKDTLRYRRPSDISTSHKHTSSIWFRCLCSEFPANYYFIRMIKLQKHTFIHAAKCTLFLNLSAAVGMCTQTFSHISSQNEMNKRKFVSNNNNNDCCGTTTIMIVDNNKWKQCCFLLKWMLDQQVNYH